MHYLLQLTSYSHNTLGTSWDSVLDLYMAFSLYFVLTLLTIREIVLTGWRTHDQKLMLVQRVKY